MMMQSFSKESFKSSASGSPTSLMSSKAPRKIIYKLLKRRFVLIFEMLSKENMEGVTFLFEILIDDYTQPLTANSEPVKASTNDPVKFLSDSSADFSSVIESSLRVK